MKFSQFLNEQIEPTENKPSVGSDVVDSINDQLVSELEGFIMSPEMGVQKIRKVLMRYGIDMPAIYGLDSEGDEITMRVETPTEETIIYFIYALDDNGGYEFYAELTDEEGLENLLSDEDDSEEE